jgi:hypothetical protein
MPESSYVFGTVNVARPGISPPPQIVLPLPVFGSLPFTKPEDSFMNTTEILFPITEITELVLRKYDLLFSLLDCSTLENSPRPQGGRLPVSRSALLKGLICKNLKTLANLSDLVTDLSENPSLAGKCGFDPLRSIPPVERFSSFLRNTPNQMLQSVRLQLVFDLIAASVITGKYMSIDSCNILANVKENNLKASVQNRFDKSTPPKGDPDARLGMMVRFPKPFQKKVEPFWGYRNHAITDTLSELPIHEATKPANFVDHVMFIPLFKEHMKLIGLLPEAVAADAIYDCEEILRFIFDELHAQPVIPRNPRNTAKYRNLGKLSARGTPICIAGFEMKYWGKFRDSNRIRLKFVCPITHSKTFAKKVPICPWNHPNFLSGTGCYVYLQSNTGIRNKIDYNTETFRKIYNQRSSSERVFSRLLTLSMQSPSVRGLNATANHCTIAHITVLLVALAATKSGQPDRIRSIKNLFPHV